MTAPEPPAHPVTARPTVTIVTPTLNAATYFDDCLRSIELQRVDVDIEHIVVDDGSTDGTLERAAASGARIIEGERAGLYAAMNQGLAAATGEYVGVLNGDDYLYPRAVATLVNAMHESRRPWAIGRMRWVNGAGISLGELAPPPSIVSPKILASLGWSCLYHQTTYMRTDFWRKFGGFDTNYRVNADFELLLRARREARFASVNQLVAAFRRHGANLSMTEPSSDQENEEISARYGPRLRSVRRTVRFGARVYINARNPRWAITKHRSLGRAGTEQRV
jgi:glycosyltransferase involved in cell wall biosynthesis